MTWLNVVAIQGPPDAVAAVRSFFEPFDSEFDPDNDNPVPEPILTFARALIDASEVSDDEEVLRFGFGSRFAPPIGILTTLAKHFPDADIALETWEDGAWHLLDITPDGAVKIGEQAELFAEEAMPA